MAERDVPRTHLWVALTATLFGAIALYQSLAIGLVLDDAYISFRYAVRWAMGDGLSFNPGPPTEGYTNFLWVVLAAVFERVGMASPGTMPIVGVIAGVCVVWVAARSASGNAAGYDARSLVAGGIVAVAPGLTFYAGTGLETALYTLFVTAALGALNEKRDVRFAALGVLAFLTRPDAGLLLAFGITWRALGPRIAGGADSPAARIEWKSALRMAVVIAAPVMGYLAWKWSHFGGFVPLTLLAKTPVPSQAAQYTLESVAPAAGLFLVALWGAFRRPNAAPSPEARVDERRIATARVHVAFALLTAASLVAVGPDWMPAGRLLVPAIPALAIAFASMVPTVKPPSWRSSAAIPAWLAGVAVAVYVAHAAWLTVDLHGRHDHRIDEDEKIVTLVRSLQQDGMASFGTVNIGLVGYVSPTAPVFDLGGLTDAHIARLPGPHLHKHPEAAYLAAHAPDVFLLTSSEPIRIGESGQASYRPDFDVESHVFSLPWFQRTYRYAGTLMLSPNYYYHAFVERRSFGPETR